MCVCVCVCVYVYLHTHVSSFPGLISVARVKIYNEKASALKTFFSMFSK